MTNFRAILCRMLKKQSDFRKIMMRDDVAERRKSAARRAMKYADSMVTRLE